MAKHERIPTCHKEHLQKEKLAYPKEAVSETHPSDAYFRVAKSCLGSGRNQRAILGQADATVTGKARMAGVQHVLHLLLGVLDEGPLRDLHGGDSLAVAGVGGEFVLVAQQAVDEGEGTLAL